MNPAEFAIGRPRVIGLAVILAVLFGALSYVDLPRQENPTLKDRFVLVQTRFPGAEPEKVELLVSKVFEEKLSEVDDIDSMFSNSIEGLSMVQLELKKGAPLAERIEQLRNKVQEARLLLPDGVLQPDVDTRLLRTNTMILAVTGSDLDPLALREQAKTLKRHLERLPSIGRVSLLGAPREEIEVAVDLLELSHRSVPLTGVISALAERNTLLPSGELELGESRSIVQTSGAYDAVSEIGATYLKTDRSPLPIRLSDLAQISRRLVEPGVIIRYKGEPAITVALEMLPGQNALAVGDRVRRLLADLEPQLAPGLRVEVIADEPYYVGRRLERLSQSLALGLGLVVCLTFAGLGWRSGLVVSLAIPLAMTVAIGLMSLLGVPLHQISIAALVIGIGLVVDEDIVVVDNIQRHLDLGKPPKLAAIAGLGEIHMAVLAGAATTVAAFVPVMLMSGDIGDFIRSIPITVSLMLLASVAVAHFVTPLLTAALHGWSTRRGAATGPKAHRFEPLYRRTLLYTVSHPRLVLGLFAAGFVSCLIGAGAALWPPDFFSEADRHQFLVQAYLPFGSRIEETDRVARQVEARLAADEALADWTAFIGAGVPKFYYNQITEIQGENVSMYLVNTDRSVPLAANREVAVAIERDLKASLPGVFVRSQPLAQGYGSGNAIHVFVEGDDLQVLRALAVRIRDVIRPIAGVANVRESFGYDPLSIVAEVYPARASLLGISHRDVAATLRTALDGVPATSFRDGDEELDIIVRLEEGQRRDVASLEALPVFSLTTGKGVPLAQVAELRPGFASNSIQRWNRRREASITSDVKGRSIWGVGADVERLVREQVALPPGYEISFHGQPKEVAESFASLARAAIVAIFLIYIVLVIRFHSLSQPLLIVLAIPMALIGSVWGLVITQSPLSLMAFLGMISLTGIVVNDSIVLMDYINTLRRRGLALEDAVVTGATTRLRAVTLTSVTTIGGLLPLSLTGGRFFGPFGWAMIFGLAASMVLTLLVQPAAYLTLERRRKRDFTAPLTTSVAPGSPI